MCCMCKRWLDILSHIAAFQERLKHICWVCYCINALYPGQMGWYPSLTFVHKAKNKPMATYINARWHTKITQVTSKILRNQIVNCLYLYENVIWTTRRSNTAASLNTYLSQRDISQHGRIAMGYVTKGQYVGLLLCNPHGPFIVANF